jgi:hypothetical protein
MASAHAGHEVLGQRTPAQYIPRVRFDYYRYAAPVGRSSLHAHQHPASARFAVREIGDAGSAAHRRHKIEELTGPSLRRHDDRFLLNLGLQTWRLAPHAW